MVDVLISFDTTGSMSNAIATVRRNVKDTVKRLFKDLPGVRIGIIAHGDYCDEGKTYLMKHEDFTTNEDKIIDFITETGNTGGGDYPEAYEYVLHEAQKLSWESEDVRVMVVIADAYPHTKEASREKLDWREEVDELAKMGVSIYSVQCLNKGNPKCYTFYKTMATKTNGYHLQLAQFSTIAHVLTAIFYKQDSDEKVQQYQDELVDKHGVMTNNMKRIFAIILGKEATETIEEFDKKYATDDDGDEDDLRPCPPAKFQVIDVDEGDAIKQFVLRHGLTFKTGRGFYEFTKPEYISDKKEIVLMDRVTGDLYEGRRARRIAEIPKGMGKSKLRPTAIEKYIVFVQSTSYNRKLVSGTRFLYEVPPEA